MVVPAHDKECHQMIRVTTAWGQCVVPHCTRKRCEETRGNGLQTVKHIGSVGYGRGSGPQNCVGIWFEGKQWERCMRKCELIRKEREVEEWEGEEKRRGLWQRISLASVLRLRLMKENKRDSKNTKKVRHICRLEYACSQIETYIHLQ